MEIREKINLYKYSIDVDSHRMASNIVSSAYNIDLQAVVIVGRPKSDGRVTITFLYERSSIKGVITEMINRVCYDKINMI